MSKSKFVGFAVASAVAVGAWGLWSTLSSDEVSKADKLANQVWIDRVPENDRDMITHLLLLDHPQAKNFGVIGRSSQWRHQIEVTRWQLKGSQLGLFFPQERSKTRLKARTWNCEGDVPAPFDLCLELKRGDRSVTLYSNHDWVVEPQTADAEGQFAALVDEVDALNSLQDLELMRLGDLVGDLEPDAFAAADVLAGPLSALDGPVDEDDDE